MPLTHNGKILQLGEGLQRGCLFRQIGSWRIRFDQAMAWERDQLEILKEPCLPLLQIGDEVLQGAFAENGVSEPPDLVVWTNVLLQVQYDNLEFLQEDLQVGFHQITDGAVKSVTTPRKEEDGGLNLIPVQLDQKPLGVMFRLAVLESAILADNESSISDGRLL